MASYINGLSTSACLRFTCSGLDLRRNARCSTLCARQRPRSALRVRGSVARRRRCRLFPATNGMQQRNCSTMFHQSVFLQKRLLQQIVLDGRPAQLCIPHLPKRRFVFGCLRSLLRQLTTPLLELSSKGGNMKCRHRILG